MEPDEENPITEPESENPAAGEFGVLVPITRIGVETELSRYPIHHLAKKGNIEIHIQKIGPKGTVDLRWEVSYNSKYGPPRQLAYKLDTLVINRRIDEEPRPLQKLIKLGSLREIAEKLDLGGNTNKVRRALRQNVGALIAAKLKYRTAEGGERTLEADFNRYSAIFTGEQLPDGRKADAVYLVLNDIYREVLNTAPIKPLNYDYLKSLPPAPQRFYEIISSRIYAAQKNRNPFARITYSDFTTYSALTRHFDYENFRVQMSKLLRPHIRSKYISAVEFEDTYDDQGREDWMMKFAPGPRARAEYMTFARKTKRQEASLDLLPAEAGTIQPQFELRPAESKPAPRPAAKTAKAQHNHPLLAELTRRGIGEGRAQKLLAEISESQPILDQLEWGDHLVKSDPGKIKNPAGFFITLLAENVMPPASFIPSRIRKLQEADRLAKEADHWSRIQLEAEYDEYVTQEVERYIESLPPSDYQELYRQKRTDMAKTFNLDRFDRDNQERLIRGGIRAQVRSRVPVMSLAQFREERQKQPGLFDQTPVTQETAPGAAVVSEPTAKPKPARKAPLRPTVKATVSGVGESATDQLQQRYQEWWARQVQTELNKLGMMERGRRLKAVRSSLLNDDPNREHYRQMLVEGEFDDFTKLAEKQLAENTARDLNLPVFEVWLSDLEG